MFLSINEGACLSGQDPDHLHHGCDLLFSWEEEHSISPALFFSHSCFLFPPDRTTEHSFASLALCSNEGVTFEKLARHLSCPPTGLSSVVPSKPLSSSEQLCTVIIKHTCKKDRPVSHVDVLSNIRKQLPGTLCILEDLLNVLTFHLR